MARTGLDKAEVKRASEKLVAQGRYPSVDAVRVALGNTGSKTTIHKYLKELEQESGSVTPARAGTARTLQDMVDELAARLHADADVRVEQVRSEYVQQLQRNSEQMAMMRAQIERLSFELRQAEIAAHNTEWAVAQAQAKPNRLPGFGIFSSLISSTRSGKQGRSTFSDLFGSRSGTEAATLETAPGYPVPSPT